jgi:hypothetical protein
LKKCRPASKSGGRGKSGFAPKGGRRSPALDSEDDDDTDDAEDEEDENEIEMEVSICVMRVLLFRRASPFYTPIPCR